MSRPLWYLSATRLCGCALGAILICGFSISTSSAVPVTVTDSFGANFDYLGGTVPAPWSAIYNPTANQNAGVGVLNANITNPGTLTIDSGVSTGWENGRSSAPFLAAPVPAGKDFRATVKIAAQTWGDFSGAGLVARAADAVDGPGAGALNTDEDFVTNFLFRNQFSAGGGGVAGSPDSGSTLNKRIEAGAGAADINININAGNEPSPIWLRLERVNGSVYRSWASTDGINFQFQSRTTPAAANSLRNPAVALEVGLDFQMFSAVAGQAQFDDFELVYDDPAAAPGVPTLSSPGASISVLKGTPGIIKIVGSQGPLSWARTGTNLAGTDQVLPGTNGGAQTLVPQNLINETHFRWDVPATQANGVYTTAVTATNDWGQASSPITLSFTVTPEPASFALAGFGLLGVLSLRRRK